MWSLPGDWAASDGVVSIVMNAAEFHHHRDKSGDHKKKDRKNDDRTVRPDQKLQIRS